MPDLRYVFIDESGDLGRYGYRYFTLACLITADTKRLNRIIKKVRQRKLKKNIKELMEVKAAKSDERIRRYVLNEVKNTDCDIFLLVVDKNKVLSKLFEAQNRLYNYLCSLLMKQINIAENRLVLTIDKKHTNTALRKDFDVYIRRRLLESKPGLNLEVYQKTSESSNELQVTDFIAWAVNRKFNNNDDSYYAVIKSKIKNETDMLIWK